MATEKRSRIFEIIIGILMIRPTVSTLLSFYSIGGGDALNGELRKAAIALCITVPPAIIIFTRKYFRKWTPFLIAFSAAMIICSGRIPIMLRSLVRIFRMRDPLLCLEYFMEFVLLLCTIAAAITAILMSLGKLHWKNMSALLKYLYIMAGIGAVGSVICRSAAVMLPMFLLLICFMYRTRENTCAPAFIGWAASFVCIMTDYISEIAMKIKMSSADMDFFSYLSSAYSVSRPVSALYALAVMLLPLVLLERKDPLERIIIEDKDNDEDDDND